MGNRLSSGQQPPKKKKKAPPSAEKEEKRSLPFKNIDLVNKVQCLSVVPVVRTYPGCIVSSRSGLTPIASCSLLLSHCLNSYGNNEADGVSDGEGGGYDADIGAEEDNRRKRARRAIPAVPVPIKREGTEGLSDGAEGSLSQSSRSSPAERIRLRPTPPLRPAEEEGAVVKTEMVQVSGGTSQAD